MIINLIVIIIILILGHVYLNLEAQTQISCKKQYITAVSALLILQSGLRNWAVGADTYQYYKKFEEIKYTSWANIQESVRLYYHLRTGKDPGYDVLQKIVQYILPHYQLYLIFIAVIFFLSLGVFIFNNTTRTTDIVLAYVFYSSLFYNFFSITGHRQTIATAATLYGFELIKKRKLVSFLILMLLASSIHKSCLIFVPFYFIAPLKNTKLYTWGALALFPVLMTYRTTFAQILQDLGGYQDFQIYEEAGTYTFSTMLLLVAVVALWRMKKVIWQHKEATPIFNAFILAVFFTPLTWVNPAAMRAVQYYSIFMLLLVPAVINSFEIESYKMRKMAFLISLYLLIGLFIKANINSEYKFYWQEMSLGDNYK